LIVLVRNMNGHK